MSSSHFYKKTVFKKLGYYDLKYPLWADYDLNLKWFFSTQVKHRYIPLTVAHYSEGGVSGSHKDEAMVADYPYIMVTRARKHLARYQKINMISAALDISNLSTSKRILLKDMAISDETNGVSKSMFPQEVTGKMK